MQVLIIGNPASGVALKQCLAAKGHLLSLVDTGEEGLDFAKDTEFDCILLDTGIPESWGKKFVRLLRIAKVTTPVIVLADKPTKEELIKLLGEGADDYISQPFDCEVLVARLEAVVRRTQGRADATAVCGELEYNFDQRVLKIAGQQVSLYLHGTKVLQVLFSRPGHIFSRETILNRMYPLGGDGVEERLVDTHVSRVRKQMLPYTEGRDYIESVRGRGYRLRDPRTGP